MEVGTAIQDMSPKFTRTVRFEGPMSPKTQYAELQEVGVEADVLVSARAWGPPVKSSGAAPDMFLLNVSKVLWYSDDATASATRRCSSPQRRV